MSRRLFSKTGNYRFEKGIVFVGMSFGMNGGDEVYSAIKSECALLELTAKRADKGVGAYPVFDRITGLLDDCEFAVFDLTEERPNVYLEIGWLMAREHLAEHMLFVAKLGTQLHFNVSGFQVRQYDSTEELRGIIRRQMKRMKKLSI
ncbi:MAG: hypothetical protein U0638_03265 [Phycisphaerales bacterium]